MIDVNLAKEKNCKVPICVGGIGKKDFGNTVNLMHVRMKRLTKAVSINAQIIGRMRFLLI